jgi:predicted metalloendopeptidase
MRDEKKSHVYRSYISAPQLTAYDYTIYIEDTKEDSEAKKYKKEYKARYLQYIENIFDVCLKKNHGLHATDVWDAEYDILEALGCNGIKKDQSNGYNVVTKDESINKCGLDWVELTKKTWL